MTMTTTTTMTTIRKMTTTIRTTMTTKMTPAAQEDLLVVVAEVAMTVIALVRAVRAMRSLSSAVGRLSVSWSATRRPGEEPTPGESATTTIVDVRDLGARAAARVGGLVAVRVARGSSRDAG
jgi:hypothetical protein